MSLEVTFFVESLVKIGIMTEGLFNSVERLNYYTNVPIETTYDEIIVANDWPDKGEIKFENYKMKYRENLPFVLKNVTFEIRGGERVGVCGRTGSGKSSLVNGLLRLVESSEGSIKIDGIDISNVNIGELRRAISVIPQDPVLFSGTVRSNLDPFEKHSDEEVWSALQKSNLNNVILSREDGLNSKMEEGGTNFSVGERQLLCLARAIIRNCKILVLDECSSSVDMETDKILQESIKENFKNCTIISIAHRLSTIIDFDRILVMDDGKVAEFDIPSNLKLD